MSCNCENRIRDPLIPRNTRVARDVGSAVDVPKPSEVVVVTWLLTPGRIGDHVAVFREERLNGLEDPRVSDSPLDNAAAIEHFVTKGSGVLRRISSLVWWIFLKNSFDIRAERGKFVSHEDALENDVTL